LSRFTLIARTLVVAAATAAAALIGPASAEASTPRTFTCSGSLDYYTQFTVTGQFSENDRPMAVSVTSVTGASSKLAGRARSLGASLVHPGYVTWDVTGAGAAGDLYHLSTPKVLPGGGGYFDADLEVLYAGGVNGSNAIPMMFCTVTGGSVSVSKTRTFSCTGTPSDPLTKTTVTGKLDRTGRPTSATVVGATGTLSTRTTPATSLGASWFQTGYTDWDITGPDATASTGDTFDLHFPNVVPPSGGYVHALLEITYAAGGAMQVEMADCTIR